MGDIVDRLNSLLPELNYNRETHRQWRDCEQKYRDRNPEIGDSKFHADCVKLYDERIESIKLAIIEIKSLRENIEGNKRI